MAGWVISITAIAILSMLCDVILPDGAIKKYARTVFGVVVTFVIVQSLGSFAGQIDEKVDGIAVQQAFLDSVSVRSEEQLQQCLRFVLDYNGYKSVQFAIDGESVFIVDDGIDEEARAKIRQLVEGIYKKVDVVFGSSITSAAVRMAMMIDL